jgi:hypothetical protein
MKIRKLPVIGFVSAGALAAALVVGSAVTTTATAQSGFDHFIACAGWLFTDPDAHAANCLPGRIVGPTESPSTSVTGPGGDDYYYYDDLDDSICDSTCDGET